MRLDCEMVYERKKDRVFTISELLLQISEFIEEHGELPSAIRLPAQEYAFLGYLRKDINEKWEHVPWDTFRGIPLKINTEEQTNTFVF